VFHRVIGLYPRNKESVPWEVVDKALLKRLNHPHHYQKRQYGLVELFSYQAISKKMLIIET
jgi:hypothetical protein